MALFTAVMSAAAAGLLSAAETTGPVSDWLPSAISAGAVLVAAFAASIGWMVTVLQKEKGDLSAATLQIIRDQMYGDGASVYRNARDAVSALRREAAGLLGEPPEVLPADVFERDRKAKLAQRDVDAFLSMLDQLACGVRLGHLDYLTMKLILRPRFIRFAYVLHPYIARETRAQGSPPRATTATWGTLPLAGSGPADP